MFNNGFRSNSLRSAKKSANENLYGDLAKVVLSQIGDLADFNTEKKVSIDKLKSKLGITYEALAKAISILKNDDCIILVLTERSELSPIESHDLSLRITKHGIKYLTGGSLTITGGSLTSASLASKINAF